MGTTPVIIDPLHPSELAHRHDRLRATWSRGPRLWRLVRRRPAAVPQPAGCVTPTAA